MDIDISSTLGTYRMQALFPCLCATSGVVYTCLPVRSMAANAN